MPLYMVRGRAEGVDPWSGSAHVAGSWRDTQAHFTLTPTLSEERLTGKLSVEEGGTILSVAFVESQRYNVSGDTGIDIGFEVIAEFEEFQHCQDIFLDVSIMVIIPRANPVDFACIVAGSPQCGMQDMLIDCMHAYIYIYIYSIPMRLA